MLDRIKLSNFKCFEQLDLSCGPLNLLCGLNGMGKSSVVQALLVLRQSFETRELLEGRLVLGGERVDLGAGADVLYEDARLASIGFEIRSTEVEDPLELDFRYSRTSDQLTALVFKARDYLPIAWRGVPPFGGNLVYVNAERVGPRKLFPQSEVMANQADFGTSGEFAWNYLSSRQNDVLDVDDPRCMVGNERRLRDVVDQWMQDVSPGVHLHLQEIPAADAIIPSFSFDRPGDVPTRPFRATNVGFGLSYVLSVILALLSPAGTLCLIENPESHLHPRGQTKLAELAARAALAGVQVFAETHSDHFMDGIRIAVRDGLIAPTDAYFNYFERDGGKALVSSPDIDSDGRLSHWPIGFFDQHEENLARLLAPRS